MDTRSEPSSTSLSNEGVVVQNEVKYRSIPWEEAFRIRFDIQLYFQYRGESRIRGDFDTPESYRRKSSEEPEYAGIDRSWWRDQDFFIEVAQDRDEYVPEHVKCEPEQRSCDQARKRDREVRPR